MRYVFFHFVWANNKVNNKVLQGILTICLGVVNKTWGVCRELYIAISIKVVPEQSGKVEYEREKLAGSRTIKNTHTEQNLVSRDT